ncbi:MAG: transglutaminase-like cysteine peptidase [Asticcacaulis sp.]|nr:transglutaminase-like cysteine peptidase [Asticcacaulis sp.]
MRSSDYAALVPAIAKLGVLASLLGLGACSSVSTTAALDVRPAPVRTAAYMRTTRFDTAEAPRRTDVSSAPRSDAMPVGQRTAAPMGFLELCSRSPMDCWHGSEYDPQRIRTLARENLVIRYQVAMGGHTSGPEFPDIQVAATGRASVPAPAVDAPQIDRTALVDGFVSGGVHRLGGYLKVPADTSSDTRSQAASGDDQTPGVVALDVRPMLGWGTRVSGDDSVKIIAAVTRQTDNGDRPATAGAFYPAEDYVRIAMDTATQKLLRSANDQVNGTMRAMTDVQAYGVSDYWAAPALSRGVRGDCEDFALEKRRLLIEHGVPAAALSIAIVRTRRGEEHAVLVVTTDAGDYVLDNLAYDVRPWRRAGYTWISRQGPGNDLAWVSLAPANATAPAGAATVYVANAR